MNSHIVIIEYRILLIKVEYFYAITCFNFTVKVLLFFHKIFINFYVYI